MLEEKFPGLSVSREHIAKVLRDNNKTRKRLRKVHQPATYRGKTRDHKKEVKDYIEEARKHDMDKIICLDETAIYAALKPSYARCNSGKRCYVKTTDSQVHKHYSLARFTILMVIFERVSEGNPFQNNQLKSARV